jgi:hypothetical protein
MTALLLWGGTCALIGTAVYALLILRRWVSPVLTHFARLTLLWGLADAGFALYRWRHLALRDYGGALRLNQALWFSLGLATGGLITGGVLLGLGWARTRREGVIGSGIAILVQSSAIVVLSLQLLVIVARSL